MAKCFIKYIVLRVHLYIRSLFVNLTEFSVWKSRLNFRSKKNEKTLTYLTNITKSYVTLVHFSSNESFLTNNWISYLVYWKIIRSNRRKYTQRDWNESLPLTYLWFFVLSHAMCFLYIKSKDTSVSADRLIEHKSEPKSFNKSRLNFFNRGASLQRYQCNTHC